jgi:transcription termination factor Rho
MSVLDRSELEQSHLADLHAIASELGIEGYRRLGRDALIDAILAGDGGKADDGGDDDKEDDAGDGDDKPAAEKPRGRGRRLRLRRDKDEQEEEEEPDEPEDKDDGAEVVLDEGDDSQSAADEPKPRKEEKEEEDVRTGVLDILPGGSGFMRADAFVHAREDVYVSPAQIRRCELRAGDEISGPVRPPRRSERYPSLVRVETVNGQSADSTSDRASFDDLTPTFATEAL